VHVQSLLGDRSQTLAAGRIPDLANELHALRVERLSPPVEVAKRARLVDSIGSPSNDARGYEDETK